MLEITNLNYKNILKDINIKISNGEIINILGENGAGKSSFVRCICNLNEYEGSITYSKNKEYKVGLVFQNPEYQFIRNIVIDDLAFSLESLNMNKEQIDIKINKLAKDLQFEDLLYKNITELSGGQKQKIAIASIILLEPEILILDEAFEMIDYKTAKFLQKYIVEYAKNKNIILINITHNINSLQSNSKIIYLKNKTIYKNYSVEKFLNDKAFLKEERIELPIYKQIEEVLNKKINSFEEMKRELCKLN